MITDVGNGKLMAYLARHGEILSNRYSDEQVIIHCRIPAKHLGRLQRDGVLVRDHGKPELHPSDS